ncbi:Cupredoxin [Xylariales sp. PMI_506]|nr:Cupredoxin [Xylariales sp. PMI_506]
MLPSLISAPLLGAFLSFSSLADAACRLPANVTVSHSSSYTPTGTVPPFSTTTGAGNGSGSGSDGGSDNGNGSHSNSTHIGNTTYSGNTPHSRSQWYDYTIDTDYTTISPDTGVVREYWFELTEITASPDGVERFAMAINGSIPGPTIYADWGDTVVVHVTNALQTSSNGTSIHFHGIRQNYTNQNDGVSSITQCPTPPGHTETYTWKAIQYGSTWYHSHFALQAWQGVFGGIVINGPATHDYDNDMGIMFLNDWDHQTVDALFLQAETQGPPTLGNALINGTNVFVDENGVETGHRWNASVTEGESYRFRLVNGAVDTHFKFMIDNHTLTVIASDLVPIEPYNTTVLNIGIGQRYDVIVTANQGAVADSFWLRAYPQTTCSDNDSKDNIRGIIYYGNSDAIPTTSPYDYVDSCDDETANLVPWVAQNVGPEDWSALEIATIDFGAGAARWYLNTTTMIVNWDTPTLKQIYEGTDPYPESNAVFEVGAEEWVYLLIETSFIAPHPIHLHGHDYFVLSQGTGLFDNTTVLNTINPPRRDTAMLPLQGHLALAFKTDNPGAWLMHCHIGWHTSEGFALQFIERKDEIMGLTNTATLLDTCSAWSDHQSATALLQEDSGI